MATFSIKCGTCGELVAAEIIHTVGITLWLQCPGCYEGSVRVETGAVYPTAPAGGTVPNLPADIGHTWREARTTHAVAAYTASEIMCRKILMHLAVDVANSDPGKSFVEYVNALDAEGYVSKGLKPAVAKIKDRGNVANHELPASTEAESLATLGITEHLLRSIYEFPDA